MSLRTRIALIASAAVAAAVLAIAVIVYVAAENRLVAEVDESLTDRLTSARSVGDLVGAINQRGPRRGPFDNPRGFEVVYLQLTVPDQHTFVPPGQEILLPAFSGDGLGDGQFVLTEATVDGIHLRIANVGLGGRGVLQIARSLEEVDATLASLALTLSLVGALGIAGAALLGLVVARSSLRPIAELTEAAEKVAATKQLAERIDVARDDELGRLAESFNEMMEALESSREQQHRLVRDAGHELRTPLTALRTNIELLTKAAELPQRDRDAIHSDLNSELVELTDLVNEIIELAAAAEVTEPEVAVDLEELAEDVLERFRRRTSQPIALQAEAAATVRGRRTGLERALGNLVDNAAKWSAAEAPIEVSIVAGRIAVSNSGPGIKPEERDRVFDRFYRAPEARAQPGSGLGLSIVKQVIESHSGKVFVEDGPEGETVVGFELPTDSVSADS